MSNNSDKSGTLRVRRPASIIRRYTFDDGEIEVWAKYAQFRDGDPARLWTYGAREVEVRGLECYPPHSFDDDPYSTLRAFYTGYETNTIVYYFETWEEEAELGFVPNVVAWELHELTHWAVDEEDNETGEDHWERWNSVLGDVVRYVMGSESWDGDLPEPEPFEIPRDQPKTTQTTLSEAVEP